jgi:hypothetical protein
MVLHSICRPTGPDEPHRRGGPRPIRVFCVHLPASARNPYLLCREPHVVAREPRRCAPARTPCTKSRRSLTNRRRRPPGIGSTRCGHAPVATTPHAKRTLPGPSCHPRPRCAPAATKPHAPVWPPTGPRQRRSLSVAGAAAPRATEARRQAIARPGGGQLPHCRGSTPMPPESARRRPVPISHGPGPPFTTLLRQKTCVAPTEPSGSPALEVPTAFGNDRQTSGCLLC